MSSIAALTRKEKKDLRILAWFTAVYCCDKHRGEREKLSEWIPALPFLQRFSYCPECHDFLCYAIDRRLKCPLPDKPSCKHCHIRCYRRGHREKVREIMRYSGRVLIKRGRLDLLWHYLF